MVSVYLANKEILAVVGGAGGRGLRKACAGELPGGALRGGVVINEEQFTAGLQAFWRENDLPKKDVQLVLGDGRVVLRAAELPPAKPAQTETMVQQEMADLSAMNAGGALLADYMTLAPKPGSKSQQVLCAAMDPEVLGPLEASFAAAGVRLAGITAGQLSVLALLQRMPELEKTCAVLLLDGDNVRVLLLDDGHYKYSGSTRAFGAPGTEEFAGEVVSVLLNARQFQSTDKNAQRLEKIYTVNLAAENLDVCTAAIAAAGFNCEPLPEMKGVSAAGQTPFLSRWAYPVGAMMKPTGKGHYVNFLALQKSLAAKENKTPGMARKVLPYAVLGGVGVLVTAVLFGYNLMLQTRIDADNAYLNRESTVNALTECDTVNAETASLQQEIAALQSFDDTLNSYPLFTEDILQQIQSCGGDSISVTFTGYDGNTGAVQFSAASRQVIDIPGYIGALEGTGLFNSVTYSGYGYQAALQSYTIRVSCALNATAGRQG